MKRIERRAMGVKRRSTVRRLSMSQLREWGWERVSAGGAEVLGATMLSGGCVVRVDGKDLAVTEVQREGKDFKLWGWDMEGKDLRGRQVSARRVYLRGAW